MYGSVWNRAPERRSDEVESTYADGMLKASAVEKPNRHAAPNAPNGRHFPKISAARAMNPRPPVMFSLNECVKPIERYAPPIAASMPDTVTQM